MLPQRAYRCAQYQFQCSSASRKVLNPARQIRNILPRSVSVLFSEPKIPQYGRGFLTYIHPLTVSVLFSEPKIPQCCAQTRPVNVHQRFSALQRAENSSMHHRQRRAGDGRGFSALQRAENSSIRPPAPTRLPRRRFQCSSASRKFLNIDPHRKNVSATRFQCSSASRKFLNTHKTTVGQLDAEFQCSSASRKFLNLKMFGPKPCPTVRVSVLFSEPKIPQLYYKRSRNRNIRGFSALQRAENSSIIPTSRAATRDGEFQCSSASRKFLNQLARNRAAGWYGCVSVLFSEPKIPQ